MKLLQDYQGRVCPLIVSNGGSIDKFLGDGILASFGAVAASTTAAADALRAADAVLAAADRWADERRAAGLSPLSVGLAVASGRVVFGAVGDGERLELTVIGDAVNFAAKLEKHNKDEKTRASGRCPDLPVGRAAGLCRTVPCASGGPPDPWVASANRSISWSWQSDGGPAPRCLALSPFGAYVICSAGNGLAERHRG